MRLVIEIRPWMVLELHRTFSSIRISPDDHQLGQEADYLKVGGEFVGVSHLTVLGFQCLSAARFGVHFGNRWRRIVSVGSDMFVLLFMWLNFVTPIKRVSQHGSTEMVSNHSSSPSSMNCLS